MKRRWKTETSRKGWMVRVKGKFVGPIHSSSVKALSWALTDKSVPPETPFDYTRVEVLSCEAPRRAALTAKKEGERETH